MKKYNSLDLLKLLLAICVIAIHTDPLAENTYGIYEMIINSAVPCFLMISGFLIFKKNDSNNDSIKKHLIKILKLYLIWTLLYLPISIYFFANSNDSIQTIIIRFFKDFIFVGQQPYSYPLWYLLSTFYCLVIVYIFKKKNIKDGYLLCTAIILYFIGVCIDYYMPNINNMSGIYYNIFYALKHTFGSGRMFYSLLYFCIGMYISKNNLKYKSIYCIVISFVLVSLNYYIDFFALKLLFYLSLFMLFLSFDLKNSRWYYYLRRTSTVMYFTHMIFFFIYSLVVGFDNCKGVVGFLLTIICTIILSIIVCHIEKKHPNNKIIKSIF